MAGPLSQEYPREERVGDFPGGRPLMLIATRLLDFSISAGLEDGKQKSSQQFSTRGGGMVFLGFKEVALSPVETRRYER